MGLRMDLRRVVHRVAGTATTAMRGVDAARPAYEHGVRPALHRLGISTAIADKALSHYDGIRRAVGR